MKVFLDGEEDSFLLHKVENHLMVTQFLPLSIIHQGGLFEVGVHSEADNHKLAGRERTEHQDCVECGLGVENLGKEMGPDNLHLRHAAEETWHNVHRWAFLLHPVLQTLLKVIRGHGIWKSTEGLNLQLVSDIPKSHTGDLKGRQENLWGDGNKKVSKSDDLRVQLFTSLFTFVYMSEEKWFIGSFKKLRNNVSHSK